MPTGDKWVDRNAGPVVRPYALPGGRTEPASGAILDVITVIVATAWAQDPTTGWTCPPSTADSSDCAGGR